MLGWTVANEGRTAYIDSQLAKRRQEVSSTSAQAQFSTLHSPSPAEGRGSGRIGVKMMSRDNRRRWESYSKLTSATRRETGSLRGPTRPGGGWMGRCWKRKLCRKARSGSGRDGKPWRAQRRGSEDIKRDKLVEDILRRNRRKSPLLPSPMNICSILVLYLLQWKCTTSRPWSQRRSTMTRPRTTGSRRRSEGVHGRRSERQRKKTAPSQAPKGSDRRERRRSSRGRRTGRQQECASCYAGDVVEGSQEVGGLGQDCVWTGDM